MPHVTAPDGTRLWAEETGAGTPILFLHEFAGDHRSWEPQLAAFARRHRCVVYAARGYPPSDVPDDPAAYSQDHAVTDAIAVLDALGIRRAHAVGLSMGGFCALHLGLRHPRRLLSLTAAGAGYGADPAEAETFRAASRAAADGFEREGAAYARTYGAGPGRARYAAKDPRGYALFMERLAEHSPAGAARTLRGVQASRPSLHDLEPAFRALRVPTLIVNGDDDGSCLAPGLFLKRTIPGAALAVLPRTGHVINLEEPALFNLLLGEFLGLVEAGRAGG